MLAILASLVSGIVFATLSQSSSITLRANAGCTFYLSTGGDAPFWVGQLSNGQCRGGSNIRASTFTWFGDAFVDEQARGCWWTPPTNVLQCDVGQEPSHGFDIPCNGIVTYNGQSTFYQCRTGDGDQVNIYLQSIGVQCQPVTILADGCTACQTSPGGAGAGAGPQPASTVSSSDIVPTVTPFITGPSSSPGAPSPTSPGNGGTGPRPTTLAPPAKDCSADLSGTNHYPSLMIPLDRANPDKPYGPTLYGQVSANASTLFNFDIPASDAGKSCKVFFSMPSLAALQSGQSGSYYFTGDGSVVFSQMGAMANPGTTYNDVALGRIGRRDLGAIKMSPGNNYVIETFDCSGAVRVMPTMSTYTYVKCKFAFNSADHGKDAAVEAMGGSVLIESRLQSLVRVTGYRLFCFVKPAIPKRIPVSTSYTRGRKGKQR
ncbi:putative Ubiquitin 3 binding protein But2 C-terminal domain-containing protein [Seiridium cardinale]